MSLVESSKDEIKRSPITVVATVVGVVVSSLALLVAWFQFAGTPTNAATPSNASPAPLQVSNLLVVLAFFTATSLSFASAVRLLSRAHWFAALCISVPAAVLSAFGTMLVLHLVPPKILGPDAIATAQDVLFWGTSIVFVAVNGFPVLQDLARPSQNSKGANEAMDGLGGLLLALFLLLAWAGLVSAGISKLIRLFLI
jgi:hypothetical protein